MPSPPPSTLESTVLVLVLIVLLLLRQTFRLVTGVRYSAARLIGITVFALAFFALFAGTTIYGAIGNWGVLAWLLLAPYAASVLLVAWRAVPHVRSSVRFETRPGVGTFYQLPWRVPVLYLALFGSRLVIEALLFGGWTFVSPTLPTALASNVLYVVVGFDLLYAGSVGLVVARAYGVRQAYVDREPAGPAPRTRDAAIP